MDLATIGGLILAVAALLIALIMDGGELESLFEPSALLIIMGGTLGATTVSFHMAKVTRAFRDLARAFRGVTFEPQSLIDTLCRYAEIARREGLVVLEKEIPNAPSVLIAHGVELAVTGIDPEEAGAILRAEASSTTAGLKGSAAVLETAGGYAPTMGIIGTVMGLVHVLGNLSDTESLGPAIATAFMATLYGIATANLFWLPMAAKLKALVEYEALAADLVVEGMTGIMQGKNPRLLRGKLNAVASRLAGPNKGTAETEEER